ncbi:MAG: alpha/beta hydrolase [Thermoproteota archaeon]|nr:alpha/beta hydrolase [Thermoproteota archaeon]
MIEKTVELHTDNSFSQGQVKGNLVIPGAPIGLVIFAHGSGSGKSSLRNQLISRILNENNIGTLLFDLLNEEEQESDVRALNLMCRLPGLTLNKFNIDLLAKRLIGATEWITNYSDLGKFKLGYFGSSTGAAAALMAGTKHNVEAIVSRGGRTDLIDKQVLEQIVSPCLFIAGSDDKKVVRINKTTMSQLRNVVDKKIEVINGASHLFEEAGKIEQVAKLAGAWFKTNFK